MHPRLPTLPTDWSTAFVLTNSPRNVQRLSRHYELMHDRPVERRVMTCRGCGLVQIEPLLDDGYYDDYMMLATHSTQMQAYQSRQSREFVERFGLQGKVVKEIGCGDGFFLHSLAEAGAKAHGIEPSSGQRKVAESRGLEVEGGVLSHGRRLAAGPFDAFVTRQVLEHVDDIRDFLLTVRANLAPGAAGLVEVPHLDTLVAGSRFFDFIPEHLNYFSPRTLRLALELAGFEVLGLEPVDKGESLHALVRWPGTTGYAERAQRVHSMRADIAAFVASCGAQGKSVAIWGAGGKRISMLAVADLEGIDLLVDGDPGKQGHFTPVSHLRVESPTELGARGISAVIVMAAAYEREIARKLREQLRFEGDIVLAGQAFELIPPSGDLK